MRKNLIVLAVILILASGAYLVYSGKKDKHREEPQGVAIELTVTPEGTDLLNSGFSMNAGERMEFEFVKNEGFLVDGNYETRSAFPETFIGFRDPNGKLYQLADRITGYRAGFSGQHVLFVELPPNLRVWSGKNLKARTLSEFKQGPIKVYRRKLKDEENFPPNTVCVKNLKKSGVEE